MNLVSAGDSFIYGTELADQVQGRYSRLTYPALLARQRGWTYTSIAYPGISNSSIARRVMDYCMANPDTEKFFFVGWTFANRYEFHFLDADPQWQNMTPWLLESLENIKREIKRDDPAVVAEQLRNNRRQQEQGVYDFARPFYRHVAVSEYWETYTTLKEMLLLQYFLSSQGIGYVYTLADTTCIHGHAALSPDSSLGTLLACLDRSRLFTFPDNKGFYQWAMDNKYPVGATHPLESAHHDAADLMKEFFNELY